MLTLKTQPLPIPAWAHALQPGDVVLFAFPCTETHTKPKRRTCLVIEVNKGHGRPTVELAYGTSADTAANVGHEVHVVSIEDMAAAGVRRPTRFVGARRVLVSIDNTGWDVNKSHPSPVIGRLAPGPMARMHAVRAKIHALRDIAADRRAEARRPVVIEHRRCRQGAPRLGKAVRA